MGIGDHLRWKQFVEHELKGKIISKVLVDGATSRDMLDMLGIEQDPRTYCPFSRLQATIRRVTLSRGTRGIP